MRASTIIVVALVALCATSTAAFAPFSAKAPYLALGRTTARSSSSTSTTTTSLFVVVGKKGQATLAGRIWPVVKKFKIGPAKAKEIATNVVSVTDWQDLLVLSILAFLASPLAKFAHENLGLFEDEEEQEEKDGGKEEDNRKRTKAKKLVKKELYHMKRFGVIEFINQISKVALSVYAVDVLSIVLTTIGFTFPIKWRISEVYAKVAYTAWAVNRFLLYKRIALCRFFRVDTENMGRVEILDRIFSGVVVAISSLVLLDWMSIKMGKAMTGLFAFGSAGTLALTLASRDLVTQLLSGLFLIFSDKMYVGDNVVFGDGSSGKVVKVGWMETQLRGSDNLITRVPNTMLSSQKVSNVSRVRQSQVKQTLRFHYEDAAEIPALLEDIRTEIKKACPRLITDNSRPFRVFWTNFNEDHLEVMVDTHHNIAPLGDAYWINRQNVLIAIMRAIAKHKGVELAQLYSFATSAGEPEWRVVPRNPDKISMRDSDSKLFEDNANGEKK